MQMKAMLKCFLRSWPRLFNEWDQMAETDVVERPMEKVASNEIVEAMQKMKLGKATEPSEVSVEMTVASGEIGVKVTMELCQRVLDGRGMPDEWEQV